MTKYDDASWHSEGDFPAGLPESAVATHIGMFAAWAMLNGLGGAFHIEDEPDDLKSLENRETTPGRWLLRNCDGKLTDEDLSEEGNAFATAYYADGPVIPTGYLADYEAAFADHPAFYDVPDTWESYARIEPILNARLAAWRKG